MIHQSKNLIKKKLITVVTRDNIRTLHPHQDKGTKPKETSVVLNASDLKSIRNSALYMGDDVLKKQALELDEQKEKLAEEARARRVRV